MDQADGIQAEAQGAVIRTPPRISAIKLLAVDRDDGGLRITSSDVPGLLLSSADTSAVWRDLGPAIETLLGWHDAPVTAPESLRSLEPISSEKD